MWVLQILAPPSLRLGLLESPKNYNTYIVNIQYKFVEVWVNQFLHIQLWLFTTYSNKTNTLIIFLNVLILHYMHPKMHFLIVKMNSLAIFESNTFTLTLCYITYIH
jgi:hypothetical protein